MATIARVTRAKAPHSNALRLVSTPKLPQDLSALDLVKALPKGSVRASSQRDWLAAVQGAPQFTHKRADSYRTILTVASIMANHANWRTLASMPTWKTLMEKSHKSRRTIARVLHELREAGLLGIAVSGTTPQFSPMALADVEHNIASIYVLAKPAPLELVPDVHNSVDELGTPTASFRRKETLTRTREKDSLHESLRDRPFGGASRPDHDVFPWRTGPLWAGDVTPKRKDERLRAAFAVKSRFARVMDASDKAIASVLREFHVAGWTVNDVMWALDHRRDGSLWPHSGLDGVTNAAHWMAYRLKDWRDEHGTVYQGRSGQQQVVAAERMAQDAARREQAAHDRAMRATPQQIAAARAHGARLAAARAVLAQIERDLGVTPAFTAAPAEPAILAIPGACEHGISRKLLPGGVIRCVVCRKSEENTQIHVPAEDVVMCLHGVDVSTATRAGESACAMCRSAARSLQIVEPAPARGETGECSHGFDAGYLPNGTPRCPICRRVHTSEES